MLPWIDSIFYSLIHQKIWRKPLKGWKEKWWKALPLGRWLGYGREQEVVYFIISHLYRILCYYFDKKGSEWITFERQKQCFVPYVPWASAPMRISYKTFIRSTNRNQSVPGYKITYAYFQQSSQANILQWSQTNVAGKRKEHFCKWQRGLSGIREPLTSAPRGS